MLTNSLNEEGQFKTVRVLGKKDLFSEKTLLAIPIVVSIVVTVILPLLVVDTSKAVKLRDFQIVANPSSDISIPRGSSKNVTITIKSINGFNSTINLYIITSTNLPSEIHTDWTPAMNWPWSVTPPVNGEVQLTLTITVEKDAPTGNQYLQIFAASNQPYLNYAANISFTVTD